MKLFSMIARFLRRRVATEALLTVFCVAASFALGRESMPLDAEWRFHFGDAPGAQAADFDAAAWSPVELPHDWSIALPIAEQSPARGGGGVFQNGIGW